MDIREMENQKIETWSVVVRNRTWKRHDRRYFSSTIHDVQESYEKSFQFLHDFHLSKLTILCFLLSVWPHAIFVCFFLVFCSLRCSQEIPNYDGVFCFALPNDQASIDQHFRWKKGKKCSDVKFFRNSIKYFYVLAEEISSFIAHSRCAERKNFPFFDEP